MRKPRGILLGFLCCTLVLLSCTFAVVMYAYRMPDPDTADMNGLMRWLVTRDLRAENDQVKVQLLKRLEVEVARGVELNGVRQQLSDEQLRFLTQNADVLGQVWFSRQVDDYFAKSEIERPEFLSRRIDEIQQSPLIQSLSSFSLASALDDPTKSAGTSGEPKAASEIWTDLAGRAEAWSSAQPEAGKRGQCKEFIADVKANLFLRSLRNTFLPKW